MHTLKTYWHLFWKFRKLQLMRQLEYRADFLFWAGIGIMWSVFNYFFFGVIAGINNGIAGWSSLEMYILISVYTMLDTFVWSFFHHNMNGFTESIFSGDLNQHLLKPVDPQFIVMTRTNSYNNVPRFFLSVAVLAWVVPQLGYQPSLLDLGLFTVVFCLSLIFIYMLWFCLSCLAFWVERLDNINQVIPSLRRIWQVPREVYAGGLSVTLTMIFPLALVNAVPSEILTGRASWQWILYLAIATLVITMLARGFFFFSLKKYSGIAN